MLSHEDILISPEETLLSVEEILLSVKLTVEEILISVKESIILSLDPNAWRIIPQHQMCYQYQLHITSEWSIKSSGGDDM